MSKFNKVIKYSALAFSVFLIVSILSGIANGFNILSGIFSDNEVELYDELKNIKLVNQEVKDLDIKLNASELVFKIGEELKFETNNKKINVEEKTYKLLISEEKNSIFSKKNNSLLVVTIPEEYMFDLVNIEAGAGKINVEKLNTKVLDFELGAGKVNISKLNVSDKASVEGGAGSVTITSSNINNLDLDIGVGKFTLNSKLTGKNKIDAGVGSLNINLMDSLDNYNIKASKGIGSIKLNKETIKDKKSYGTGINYITIDGGVGDINIKTN